MSTPTDGTPVQTPTEDGMIRGKWLEGVARFAGIPFAAPPVGDLRFRPPQPVEAWDGVRPAEEFGHVCPQNPSMMDALFEGQSETWDEDCLYLNVWTTSPSAAGEPADAQGAPAKPVMVWIHGGGFEMGSGSSPLYNGTHFARSGVVLVGINYRLGSLGFLELGSLDDDHRGSGNTGILDQISALEWVRDNIAHFGGDPGNVTIFGQSAGAMSVSLLMAMPKASGLFHKAIAQSGSTSAARTPALATSDAREFLAAGSWTDIGQLRDAPVEELLKAHSSVSADRISDPESFIRRTGNPLAFLAFRPVADGLDIPLDPLAAIAGGSAQGVPLITGSTSEEWKLFSLFTASPDSEESLRKRVELVVSDPDAAIDLYRDELDDNSPAEIDGAMVTDLVFTAPVTALADTQSSKSDVYQYLWRWKSPAFGGILGAAHAVELPFVFSMVEDHRLHVLVGPTAPVELSEAITDGWVAFAHNGSPKSVGTPAWDPITAEGRPTQIFDDVSEVASDPHGRIREFWNTPAAKPPALGADAHQ